MRRTLRVALLSAVMAGCGPDFEMRKDPDLLRIDPRQAARLRHIEIASDDVARVSDRSLWQIHSSLEGAAALSDGDPATAARSNDDHRKGEYILIDLGCVCHFQNVRQQHPDGHGAPPGYRVDTAGDHGFPFTLEYVGVGEPGASLATFPRAADARFIRITLVEDAAEPWLVTELDVY